jgi:ribose-phosphate pyrophosphokinase
MLNSSCTFEHLMANNMNQTVLFSTESYTYLKNELLGMHDYINGEIIRKTFPDGEHYMQLLTDLEDKEVVLIGGTINDHDTLELYDIANGIIQLGARSLKMVIPYFGYATMERAVKVGEVVKAKNRALLLSSIPHGSVSNAIYLIDLHAEGIPYYFEKEVRCHHLYCKSIIIAACHEICGHDFILASTDAGRAKWVESLANDMQVKSAFVYKHRTSGDETIITGVNADVMDKSVIIYDDMIRTGGSLMQAAKAYHDAGAKQVFAITTHGLFTNHALEKIQQQQIITRVVCINTHPASDALNSDFLIKKSVAPIIFEALK